MITAGAVLGGLAYMKACGHLDALFPMDRKNEWYFLKRSGMSERDRALANTRLLLALTGFMTIKSGGTEPLIVGGVASILFMRQNANASSDTVPASGGAFPPAASANASTSDPSPVYQQTSHTDDKDSIGRLVKDAAYYAQRGYDAMRLGRGETPSREAVIPTTTEVRDASRNIGGGVQSSTFMQGLFGTVNPGVESTSGSKRQLVANY
jgi:uncharacterized membrane protein